MSIRLKVMADYHCWPIWWDDAERVGSIDPASLGLSRELQCELAKWAAAFDETLDEDEPLKSGFNSNRKAEQFDEEGKQLALRVAQELGPSAKVRFVRGV